MPSVFLKPDILQSLPNNQQVSGHFQLRAMGLKKLLGKIDLDIIAKQPHYLYLSIDSFFKQPARIVTYDSHQLYGIEEEKLDDILNLAITPEELVEILLRNYSHRPKQIRKITPQSNSILIQYHSGNTLLLEIDTGKLQIKKRELRDSFNQLIYSVTYENFPYRFYLEANYKNKNHAMVLSSEDVKLNQGVFDEKLFRR